MSKKTSLVGQQFDQQFKDYENNMSDDPVRFNSIIKAHKSTNPNDLSQQELEMTIMILQKENEKMREREKTIMGVIKGNDPTQIKNILENEMFKSIGGESSPTMIYDGENKPVQRVPQTEKIRRKIKEELHTDGQERRPSIEKSTSDEMAEIKKGKRNSKSVRSVVELEQPIENFRNSEPEFKVPI